MGSSMIGLLGLLALTNIFVTTRFTVTQFLRLRQLKQTRAQKLAARDKELKILAEK